MAGHNKHATCNHDVHWCRHCDVIYCDNCEMTWNKPCPQFHTNPYWGYLSQPYRTGFNSVLTSMQSGIGNNLQTAAQAGHIHGDPTS